MKRKELGKWFGPLVASLSTFIFLVAMLPGRLMVTGLAQQAEAQSQLAAADEILAEMSKTTGLPIKGALHKEVLGRPAIEKYLKENLHKEYSAEELRVQEATLRAFGLVSADFNLEQFLITFYTEQVAGFYDPHTKTMNMADWIAPEMQSMVLAHELTHALQDQNFDLDKFLHASRDNDDATSARQAVVEGYAMAAMMQHMLKGVDLGSVPSLSQMMAGAADQQLSAFPAFSNAPFFFRMQALFPYLQGMNFMQKGLGRGGWKELNDLFAHPPATTKELFEPEFYFNHTPLPKISLPQPGLLSGDRGLHLLTDNTMGELGYYSIIGQLLSEDEAKSAALAWMGDRYLVYEYSNPAADGGKYLLVARTKWTNGEKSLEFFRDYNSILQKKYPGLAPDARSESDLFIGGVGSSRVIVVRKGDEVAWAEGVPAAQTDAMLGWLRSLNN
jgi:hypothetical protein